MICYKTLFFIDIHIIQFYNMEYFSVIVSELQYVFLPVPVNDSNCIKYKKSEMALYYQYFSVIASLCLL